jgi:hypothetical protein
MSTYHLLDPAARRITWGDVTIEARALGYTVKPTGYDHERVGYPRGTNADHPAAIFTDEPEDMIGTIRADIARNQQPTEE